MLLFGPIYNTLMSLAAGLGLLLLVGLGYQVLRGAQVDRMAWAVAFGALGAVLAFLGGVMTVAWPLTGPTQFDNIAFGEPSLGMGVLLLAGAYLLGARRPWGEGVERVDPAERRLSLGPAWDHLCRLLLPLSWFGSAMGLALISIAFVGPIYEPWEAPPAEPITSEFSGTPWVENYFLAIVYALTGVGALLLPFALLRERERRAGALWAAIGGSWLLAGLAWLLFGALNYYTHIGLLINETEATLRLL